MSPPEDELTVLLRRRKNWRPGRLDRLGISDGLADALRDGLIPASMAAVDGAVSLRPSRP